MKPPSLMRGVEGEEIEEVEGEMEEIESSMSVTLPLPALPFSFLFSFLFSPITSMHNHTNLQKKANSFIQYIKQANRQ